LPPVSYEALKRMVFVKCICFAVLFLSFFIVRLHDQSNSSDEVGGLLQVLQAPIYFLVKLLMATVRFALVGVCYISEEHARLY